ncbi:MAG TPA: carboxypeptidase-like regulatory domain-containing protein, partial [Terriglobia bacterium]|nr:carboxypeptidase-like regulatory domain-containing protein [Terriglobia bacterium]
MRKIRLRFLHFQPLFTLGLLLGLGISVAHASVTASISGTVTDPTGAVMPEVSVVVLNTDTGIQTTTQTNTAG